MVPLVVDGRTYYDPADIGFHAEKCCAYALKYAVKDVGEGLDRALVLQDVWAFVRQGFFGPMELTTGQTIPLRADRGEEVVAVTAVCVAADGRTVLAGVDLTDKAEFCSGTGAETAVTVTPECLSRMAGYDGHGDWKIISYFTELSERNSVCYLSFYATRVWCRWFGEAVIDNDRFWTEVMGLAPGQVRALFDKVASGIWEDSLEAIPVGYTKYAMEQDGRVVDIFDAFAYICGYRLTPEKWTALFVGGNGLYAMGGNVSGDADFVTDPVKDKKLRHDFFRVLTELYCGNHLQVYTDWAQAQPGKLDTRVQAAYLYALDQDKAFHHVTIPEYESLNSSDRLDANRAVAGAAHAAGRNTISYEMGARSVSFTRETYSMAWYDWLWHCNDAFISGINATVLHGVEYLYGRTARVWPGPCMAMPFAALAEPTGQRMPYFRLMKETVSTYLAREQYVLTRGKPALDVAVYYYYNEVLNDYLDYFTDPALAAAGYCYEFLGDDSLRLAAEHCDGTALLTESGCYRALVIDQYRRGARGQSAPGPGARQPKDFEGQGFMPRKTARLVRELAGKGLPVVIVGKAPDRGAGFSDGPDAVIREIFAEISGRSNVAHAETEADVPAALRRLGIMPCAEFSPDTDNTDLYSFHRKDGDTDFYLFFNRSHTIHWKGEVCDPAMLQVNPDHTIRTEVTLCGEGTPVRLDCWTGEIFALPFTTLPDGRKKIQVELKPSEMLTIAVGHGFHGEKTPCFGAMTGEQTVTGWSLELKLFRPSDKWLEDPVVSSDFGEGTMTEIVFEKLLNLDPAPAGKLLPWIQLPLGEHPERASGIGVYRAEFELTEFDPAGEITVLSIDEATELFTVKVNGTPVSFPQTDAFGSRQDITAAARPGKNTLEITVAGGLWNAAKYYNTLAHQKNEEVVPQLSEESWQAPDGLLGAVTVRRFDRQ